MCARAPSRGPAPRPRPRATRGSSPAPDRKEGRLWVLERSYANAQFSVSVVPESQRHHETFPSLVLLVRCKELTKARWCRVAVWCAQLPLPLSSCPLLLRSEAEPRAWTFPTSLSSVPYQSPEKGESARTWSDSEARWKYYARVCRELSERIKSEAFVGC